MVVMKTILFQGDSITDANRVRECAEHHNGHGYPTLVSARISYQYPGKYKILNKGIGGDRVVNLLERINRDIINLTPDYMSVLIGVNDVWAGIRFQDGTPADVYEEVYGLVIKETKKSLPDIKFLRARATRNIIRNSEKAWKRGQRRQNASRRNMD